MTVSTRLRRLCPYSAGHPQSGTHLRFDLADEGRVFVEKALGVIPSLADPFSPVGKPGSAFLDDLVLDPQVQEAADP